MIIIVDKPKDITSQKVVSTIKHALPEKVKIGHTGTLDPMCTGVLPVLTGNDTTLSDLFLPKKGYRASFLLGKKTDTQDITGTVLEEKKVDKGIDDIKRILPCFTGKITQIPPMYSAIKIGGEKLYNLARAGKVVERAPRNIEIYSIESLCCIAEDEYSIEVSCSKGTYIRTLCDDIGNMLGTGATMTSLRRTSSNGFCEAQALPLDEVVLLAKSGRLSEISIDVQQPFMHFGKLTIPSDGEKYYLNGGVITACRIAENAEKGLRYRAYGEDGRYLGLCEYFDNGVKSIWLSR